MRRVTGLAFAVSVAALVSGTNLNAAVPEELSGAVRIDGSSTVYPITEAVAEEFGSEQQAVEVTVGISGTGGGFKKFCAGEIDVSNASRPIKSTETEACGKAGIEFIELPVAYDALAVVVNPKNTWASSLTVAELKKIWEPAAQGKITSWNQVRDSFPDKPLRLFGPGVDSGTFDYFTEAIVGKEDASRGDFTSSEDDNTLVQGVVGDEGALGFFGLAYYESNKAKLKLVAIDDEKQENGAGPQLATTKTVIEGTYQPLARPLFVYVAKKSLSKPAVSAFVKFYLENAQALSEEVGYVPLTDKAYSLTTARFEAGKVGSVFAAGSHVGVSIEDILGKSS